MGMEETQFKSEGFFNLTEEEKNKHLNYLFEMVKSTYEDNSLRRSSYLRYLDTVIHLDELEKHFKDEEDYEMCFIIKNMKERFDNYYEQQQ